MHQLMHIHTQTDIDGIVFPSYGAQGMGRMPLNHIILALQATKVWPTSMWCPCTGLFPRQPMLGMETSLL